MSSQPEAKNKEQNFVSHLIDGMNKDNGFRARFSRADNPATEYQCWEHLAAFNIDLDKSYIRLPYAIVAAAITRARIKADGTLGIGQSLAGCYSDGNGSDQAKSKLRRLLACDSVEEACRILRPLLSLINSKGSSQLCYSRLLTDLIWFNRNANRVKEGWAQDFYHHQNKSKSEKETP